MTALFRFVFDHPSIIPLITRVHRFVYRVSRGRLGARARGGVQILLLTTRGRRSGRARVTPLLYVEDGEHFVVVASNGGTEKVPGWWLNLQAAPDATVQAGRARRDVRARRASDEEARTLWPRLDRAYPFFEGYRERTQRVIPVVLLEPV